MHGTTICSSLLLACFAVAQETEAATALPPIDFAKVDRTAPRLPAGAGDRLYGIYLFGDQGETRIWAVLEGATAEHGPTTLFFDRNGDGDLTADDERFAADPAERGGEGPAPVKFTIGDYRPPGSDATHKDFTITWTAKTGVRFKTLWRGQKISFGGYAPTHDSYAPFGKTPAAAPVFVPGWDRPFAFERWIETPLPRGGSCDFKVFVGNRGDRVGTFAAVDDDFLPAGEFAVATLHYRDGAGKQQIARFELKQRC